MIVQENISLAPRTTFRVGGAARFFVEARTDEEVIAACEVAKERNVELLPLGLGSNIVVPDEGIDALVARIDIQGIHIEERGEELFVTAGAGVPWDEVVDDVAARSVFGMENLAGIPGTVGGAAVQNIGAYGTEFSSIFFSAEVLDKHTLANEVIGSARGEFSYRTSFFKTHPEKILLRVTMRLSRSTKAFTEYPDFAALKEAGVPLATPSDIAAAVRGIRAKKFPSLAKEGTAGSFFKNPILSLEEFARLKEKFPEIPSYDYEGKKKVPLAWILDRVLGMKGYARGAARLFERQPLVLVVLPGATAHEVEELANEVSARVQEAAGISIEREVETFGTRV
jgi:UDP-N-acetylmuramate dehydrogenase